jgi:hypothetical protein
MNVHAKRCYYELRLKLVWKEKYPLRRNNGGTQAHSHENADLPRLQRPRIQQNTHNREYEPNSSERDAQRMYAAQHMR